MSVRLIDLDVRWVGDNLISGSLMEAEVPLRKNRRSAYNHLDTALRDDNPGTSENIQSGIVPAVSGTSQPNGPGSPREQSQKKPRRAKVQKKVPIWAKSTAATRQWKEDTIKEKAKPKHLRTNIY